MTDQLRPNDLTVASYVRAPLLLEPIDAKVETLRRCEDRGDVGTLVLRSWPDAVSLDAPGPESEVVDRFRRFERWADERDVRVRPPFRIRERTSMVDDEPRRVLETPLLCLALYEGNSLVGVYPHTDGETTRTTTEAIGALATGSLPAPLADRSAEPAAERADPAVAGEAEAEAEASTDTDSGRSPGARSGTRRRGRALATADCPVCDADLVNVQGILSCRDCRWSDAELGNLQSPRAKLVYLSLVDGPKSVAALRSALDLTASSAYSILRTLSDRGLVEPAEEGRYRLADRERPAVEATNGG